MAIDIDNLQKNTIEVRVLQSNFDHLSSRVDKLCEQIDTRVCSQMDSNLLILEKINSRMQEEMVHRISSEKTLTKLSDDIVHLMYLQKTQEKMLLEHHEDLIRLKDYEKEQKTAQKTTVSGLKILGKAIAATISFCFACGGVIYAYLESVTADRNAQVAIAVQQYDEKKKRLEYNREKYLIKHGKFKDGQ